MSYVNSSNYNTGDRFVSKALERDPLSKLSDKQLKLSGKQLIELNKNLEIAKKVFDDPQKTLNLTETASFGNYLTKLLENDKEAEVVIDVLKNISKVSHSEQSVCPEEAQNEKKLNNAITQLSHLFDNLTTRRDKIESLKNKFIREEPLSIDDVQLINEIRTFDCVKQLHKAGIHIANPHLNSLIFIQDAIAEMDKNLAIAQKAFSYSPETLNPQECDSLNTYLTKLIETKNEANVEVFLRGASFKPTPPGTKLSKDEAIAIRNQEKAIRQLGGLVNKIRQNREQINSLEDKFIHETLLSFDDCRLVDEVCDFGPTIESLKRAGFEKNPYFNRVAFIQEIANKNTFSDVPEGTVLFFNLPNFTKYQGGYNPLQWLPMAATWSKYLHGGVLVRDAQGNACVGHVRGEYKIEKLKFGDQSHIHCRQVDIKKFTAKKLDETQKRELQEKFNKIMAKIVWPETITDERYYPRRIQISVKNMALCPIIFHQSKGNESLELGKAKLGNLKEALCTEMVATAIQEAIDILNNLEGQSVQFTSAFAEGEVGPAMHPQRLLDSMGPHQGTSEAVSGWREVSSPATPETGILPLDKMLPSS